MASRDATGEARAIVERYERTADVIARAELISAIADAIAAEREACAQIADEEQRRATEGADAMEAMPVEHFVDAAAKTTVIATFAHIAHAAHDIAAAIRSREAAPSVEDAR